MQVVGVGFIVSVIQDSLAEFLEWKKEGKELPI